MAKKQAVSDARSTSEADKARGARIRVLRLERNVSQTELATALGITFQQVQKYEKGTNRVAASRLERIAKTLNVPISMLYDDAAANSGATYDGLLIQDGKFSMRLLRAYRDIQDPAIRRQMVALMEACAAKGR